MSYLYNNQVGFVPTSTDAFGRLAVTTPFTLFDSSQNTSKVFASMDWEEVSR